MNWRLADSLTLLRTQVDAQWPNRNKASDGTIGDTAHAATMSDHNPNPAGVVCAFDCTHDPANGVDIQVLFDRLSANPHPDCKYLIANRRIASRAYQWTSRIYTGIDPHTSHLHVSVGVGPDGRSVQPYDDTQPRWDIVGDAPQPPEDDFLGALTDQQQLELYHSVVAMHKTDWVDTAGYGDLQWYQNQFDAAIARNMDKIAAAVAAKVKGN